MALFLSPVSPSPADGTTALTHPKLGQVSLFTSGLSGALMLELFKETPKDVTYTLMELENIY